MTEELDKLWKENKKPFNLELLHLDDLISISDLHHSLLQIYNILHDKYHKTQLYFQKDWHNHDGFITSSKRKDWNYLKDILKTQKNLYNIRDKDFAVYLAFYNPNFDFLLRFDILDEDEQYLGIWGEFDLIAKNDILNDIKNRFNTNIKKLIKQTSAKKYFDNNYGG